MSLAEEGRKAMRAVVQRVSRARVVVEGRTTGQIASGLLVLLGVARGDTAEQAAYLAEKIAHLRIFDDEQGKMNRSLLEAGGAARSEEHTSELQSRLHL